MKESYKEGDRDSILAPSLADDIVRCRLKLRQGAKFCEHRRPEGGVTLAMNAPAARRAPSKKGRRGGLHRDALCGSDPSAQQAPSLGMNSPAGDLVHAAHTAAARHSATTAGSCALLFVFLDVGHQSFRGEHQAGD